MMHAAKLVTFLQQRMSMTDVYQPVILRELLSHDDTRSRDELAAVLSTYDKSVKEHYDRVLMRWPRLTLAKHGMVEYVREERIFKLLCPPTSVEDRERALGLCKQKIDEWLDRKSTVPASPKTSASTRYDILKAANGRCELCGIPSKVSPIDIDHINPRSKANKEGKVKFGKTWVDVDDRSNLQALCYRCNRSKRDADAIDFRRQGELVRDRWPGNVENHTVEVPLKKLSGSSLRQALFEKLADQYAGLTQAQGEKQMAEQLTELVEVVFSLGAKSGITKKQLKAMVEQRREEHGSYEQGFYRPAHWGSK